MKSNDSSYRVSCGRATITEVNRKELASLLGLRVNSRRLSELFYDVRGTSTGKYDCVHAVHLLLKDECKRSDIPFEEKGVLSVATVFWHAYAKLDAALEVFGDESSRSKLLKSPGARLRLADQLTGRPSIHKYVYRGASGSLRTALDEQELERIGVDRQSAIDLEELAFRVLRHLKRPLLILALRGSSSHS